MLLPRDRVYYINDILYADLSSLSKYTLNIHLSHGHNLLSHHKAQYTELGGPDTVIVTERAAALAHDHGFQAARTLERDALHCAAVGEHLQGERRAVARTEVCFVAQLHHAPSKAFGKGRGAGGVIKAGGT